MTSDKRSAYAQIVCANTCDVTTQDRGLRCGAYGDGDGASERARGNLCTVDSTVAYSCVRYYGIVQLYVH